MHSHIQQKHIILEDLDAAGAEAASGDDAPHHVGATGGPAGAEVRKLVRLGAWQFFSDAHTGLPVDPQAIPEAIIVSTIHLEPFVARGDVQLHGELEALTRGLEHLQGLLEYQPIYLVLPDIKTPFAHKVRESVRGYAWIQLVSVPMRYPFDDFAILARHLGLGGGPESPVWALPTAASSPSIRLSRSPGRARSGSSRSAGLPWGSPCI